MALPFLVQYSSCLWCLDRNKNTNIPRCVLKMNFIGSVAWLAQSVEHETLNLRVGGSSPPLGAFGLRFKMGLTSELGHHTLFIGTTREKYYTILIVSIV